MTFAELIAAYKQQEHNETATIVLTDVMIRKLISVWRLAKITGPGMDEEAPMRDWDEMWSRFTVDINAVSKLLGVSQGVAINAVQRAVALRLVYPDRTEHAYGMAAARKAIKDALS